jgi:hypothetical protein
MIDLGGRAWIIEAQGLPNLIHEFVHVLFFGGLADDHGFDYGQIPLDLSLADHRRHLWEELACCVLSTVICAPFQDDPESFARDWFAEQFEIQGVFHGLEHNLQGFRARVDAHVQIAEHRTELLETVERAQLLVDRALEQVGCSAQMPPCDVLGIWARYRANWSVARL